MKPTLTVARVLFQSAMRAVCRPFSDRLRWLSSLRSGSLRSALTALLLAQLAALHAADDARLAVQSADDARISAMSSPKRDQLAAIFSDDLRYAHSTGAVDTKTSFIGTLTSGKTKYLHFDYIERDFSFPAPDIALMTGRVRIRAATAEAEMENALSFLAVWRKENGQWRFLAWQSCKLTPASKP